MAIHIVKPTAKAYPGTQAVLRAVRLLKSFSAERPERRLGDLTEEAGLNKTTVYRLLSALESEGLLERGAGGETYRLGPETVALASIALGGRDLRSAARPELEALAGRTRETATLEVLVGADVLILDEVMGRHVVGTRPSVGTRWPAHTTSTGKALLADRVGDGDVLEGPLPALTPKTITSPEAFARELARVRQRGYAVSAEELEPGFVAVGAAVRDGSGRAVAAVSVGGPKTRLTHEVVAGLGRLLSAATARISARLGWRA